jgi:hypothetical protein
MQQDLKIHSQMSGGGGGTWLATDDDGISSLFVLGARLAITTGERTCAQARWIGYI